MPHEFASIARALPILFGYGGADLLVPNHTARRCFGEDVDALAGAEYVALATTTVVVYAIIAWSFRRRPLFIWGLLGFALCLGPCAIIVVNLLSGLGRYFYLPLVCIAPAVGGIVASLWSRFRIARVPIVVFGVVLAVLLQGAVAALSSDGASALAAIDEFPDRSHGYALLGEVRCGEGRGQEGVALLEKALLMAPPKAKHFRNNMRLTKLSRCHLQERQFARAIEFSRLGLRLFPWDADFIIVEALSHEALGDLDAARVAIAAARRLDPTHPGLTSLTRRVPSRRNP